MNNYELQIFVDSDTAMMIQAFTDVGVSIDFDRLLKLMAENSEEIEDFIQEIETGEPRFMFPEIGRARVGKECRSRWSPYH